MPDVIPSSQKAVVTLAVKPTPKKKKRRKRKPNGFDYGRVPKKKIKKCLLVSLCNLLFFTVLSKTGFIYNSMCVLKQL